MEEVDNNNMLTKVIIYFTRTAEKCAFYKSLEQKQKQKRKNTHFGNIEYNSWEICTIVSCFAFK